MENKKVFEQLTEMKRGKEFEIPARYKFFGLLLSMPLLIFLTKTLIWLEALSKNYDRKLKIKISN